MDCINHWRDIDTNGYRELERAVFMETMRGPSRPATEGTPMPTTILDGETIEQARARRFREEAEIEAEINARVFGVTLCWKCSAPYRIDAERCPLCLATNGNVDFDKAKQEMEEAQ